MCDFLSYNIDERSECMKNVEIGKRIQQRRKALNISVVDIAARTGLSKATIHRYESGDIKDIKLPVLETIAEILDVNPTWLLGKTETMERLEYKTTNLLIALDHAIDFVNKTPRLTAGSRQITNYERCIVTKIIQTTKDILDKGE